MQAGEMLKSGKTVAIPTETVYGLGANALDEKAVAKIFEAKGRPQDNPLIVHIESTDKLELYCDDIPDKAYKLAVSFWPGPLTMVLKRKSVIPSSVSAGLDTVAIRLPSNEYARRIIAASGCPIAAPSANTSGSPSPTKAEHVLHDLDGRIDAIFDGGDSEVGLESTVISLVGDVHLRYAKVNDPKNMACIVVAYEGNTPMGCGCWKAVDEKTAEVKRIFVEPQFRRRGVASAIIDLLESHILASGYSQILLETARTTGDSKALYLSLGYKEIP